MLLAPELVVLVHGVGAVVFPNEPDFVDEFFLSCRIL
jgi:hypothetical protein